MFRSFCLCSCLLVLVNGATLKDSSGIAAPESGANSGNCHVISENGTELMEELRTPMEGTELGCFSTKPIGARRVKSDPDAVFELTDNAAFRVYDKTYDGIARRSEAAGLVQGQQLQVAGKRTETEGTLDASPDSKEDKDDCRTADGPPAAMKPQDQEGALADVQHRQNETVTVMGQKISEANQKGPEAGGGTDDEDDELVGDKIGSSCLSCLVGGGLG